MFLIEANDEVFILDDNRRREYSSVHVIPVFPLLFFLLVLLLTRIVLSVKGVIIVDNYAALLAND